MMFRVLRYVTLSFLFVILFPTTSDAVVEAPHVHIFSCQVFSGAAFAQLSDAVGLAVRFQNDSPEGLASIVWRANYGKYPVDFIDEGSFAPSVRIDNYVLFERGTTHFNVGSAIGDLIPLLGRPNPTVGDQSMWSSNMTLGPYFGTEDPENCSIVRVTMESGEVWQNPALAQAVANIPSPTPKPSPRPDTPLATPDPSGAASPIDLSHCVLSIFGKGSLSVAYRNLAGRAADSVVFRAPYESTSLDFTDHGSFSQGALISHALTTQLPDPLDSRHYLSFDDPQRCVIISVHYADGTSWQNASIDATTAPPPTPVPDALVFDPARARFQRHSIPTPLPSSSPSSAPGTQR